MWFVVCAIIICIRTHNAVLVAIDITFDADEMRFYTVVKCVDSAICIINRRCDEWVAYCAIPIIPAILIDTIGVITIIATKLYLLLMTGTTDAITADKENAHKTKR